jgi:hypothetical protein
VSKVSPANQHTEDERQQQCWDLYVSELARGISNAKAAALKVGYSEEHADNITLQGWFKGRLEKLKRRGMLAKAEAKLEKSLEYEVETVEGEKTIINVPLLTVQTNVAKHLTLTLGKDEGYSTRTENTGKDGGPQEHVVVSTENDDLVKEFEAKLRGRIVK